MRTLEYTGGVSPFVDIKSFVDKIRKDRPGITDIGVDQLVKRTVMALDPRFKGRFVSLFGADIMSADVEDIPAWNYLPPIQQRRILAHPINGGIMVDSEDPRFSQRELVGANNHAEINRSALISPPGLTQTYCWCHQTNWLQDMPEEDYNRIRAEPALRRLFRDPNVHGLYLAPRSYQNTLVRERHIARDASDIKVLKKQYSRSHAVQGVTLEGENNG
jgi:hypothetical protein